jgi:hypothetical protein
VIGALSGQQVPVAALPAFDGSLRLVVTRI